MGGNQKWCKIQQQNEDTGEVHFEGKIFNVACICLLRTQKQESPEEPTNKENIRHRCQ